MGGSGGGTPDFGRPSGGSGGGGPSGGDGVDPCASLTGVALIATPNPDIVPDLSIGELLALSLSPGNKSPVLAHTNAGDLVGTVMPPFLVQLVDCMQAGNAYEAEILEISGGAVKVRIQPEGS